jgi:hypothetical protein
MSVGNLTNSVLSLNTCYVNGVAITGGAVAPPVSSVNTLIGTVGVESPLGTIAITPTSSTTINLETKYRSGVASGASGFQTTTFGVPGLNTNSIIQVTMSSPDQTATTYLVRAVPINNAVTLQWSATLSSATTAKVTWVVVKG